MHVVVCTIDSNITSTSLQEYHDCPKSKIIARFTGITYYVQGALPNAEPEAYEPAKAASEGNTHSNGNSDHQRTKRAKEGKLELVQEETTEDLEEGKGVDGRPMLLPGTLLTLSCDCAHALMTFAEEVKNLLKSEKIRMYGFLHLYRALYIAKHVRVIYEGHRTFQEQCNSKYRKM